MSAFSRGCLLRHQCAFKTPRSVHLFPSKSYPTPRFFSSSSFLQAVKKARTSQPLKTPIPTHKPSITPTKAPRAGTAVYQSYATTLAQKAHPTLLYQAPSHTLFMVTSYGTALFCLTYAGVSFLSNSLFAPPDLSAWVPYAFGGISFMMAALGGWILLGPSRIVRSITALPKHANTALGAAAGKNAAAGSTPQLQLEIELKKMFPVPFFPPRKLYVQPSDITIPRPFIPVVDKRFSVDELRRIRLQEEQARKQELEYERSHIMSAPFRHMSRAFFHVFKALGRTWTREGFLKVDVKGHMYKVDLTGGWALEGGRALDRLVVLKP